MNEYKQIKIQGTCDNNINLHKLKVLSLFSGCGGMDLGFRGDFSIFNNYYENDS